jgi:Restriction endonuclease
VEGENLRTAPRNFDDRQLRSLKEAVRNVFWKRSDIRRVFERCGVPSSLISSIDWENNKTWDSVDQVLEALNTSTNGAPLISKIAKETLDYPDGKHLAWAGGDRVTAASDSLTALRDVLGEKSEQKRKAEAASRAREAAFEKANKTMLRSSKLQGLYVEYAQWFSVSDANHRGLQFESLLCDVFDLFDLAPRSSFRRVGEQIDGAFILNGEHFLMEAKWQQDPVNLADLRDLDGAVNTSLETTLGLFISVMGFSPPALAAYTQGNRPRLLCMDGSDLSLVLEGRIDLCDLLERKKEIAVQKRVIFATAQQILQGAV